MQKAIVIGATSGIGRGLAKILSKNNYKVGITGRRMNLLTELQNENKEFFVVKSFDIIETDKIAQNLEELVNEIGGLNLIIISSGTGDLNEQLDFKIEKQTIDTNVSGFTAIADWAFNYFKNQGSGHLVGITSIAGLRGGTVAPSYNATKAFQIRYLEGLRQKADKLKFPIHITDIRPGFVNTAMAKGDNLFWVSSVEKAAKQIYKAIITKRKIVYVTKRWILFAFIFKLIPNWIYRKL
jgi:Short-chain dehydrogenases of various substrate specificities